MRSVKTTPARMVEEDGSINFGTFLKPFRDANILDSLLYSAPCKIPDFWKRFRLKQWQHFGIITPSHYLGVVIFDARFMGVSFFYVYDRIKNQRFEHARQLPGSSALVAAQVYDDRCEFAAKGYQIRFENKLDQGFHRIHIDIGRNHDLPAVKGEIEVYEDLNSIEPLVQVSPITAQRPFYTHKVAAPASGTIMIDSREIVLDRKSTVALIDEQKTFYPYVSFWKWATAAGFDSEGRIQAFNLCENMIADDEDFNENCFWIDGKIHCLNAARFEFENIMQPWKMKTTDGKADLNFVPAGERAEKISVGGLIKSDFHQPFGLYNGTFKDDAGRIYPISNFFGLAEHHITRY